MTRYFASLDASLPKPWERVWAGGVDVTTEPVETWPAVFKMSYIKGWRPKLYPDESVEWPDDGSISPTSVRGPHAAVKSRRLGR
jgi:hypothetical protein